MTDVLEKREYLVGVTIIEGRNIQGKDSAGTSDPFVKIRCADQVQQSQKKYEQNSAIWNQSMTFTGIQMNQYELETFELIIELYDHNAIYANELIGQYSIGLSTLYRNLNHEFYKTWIGMLHPEDASKAQAYLQISCFIVGPNERPPVHASGEEVGEEDQDDDEDLDEEEIIKKIELMQRCKGVTPISDLNIIQKTYQLTAMVVKAEHLPFFEGSVHPFVSCRANGFVLTSKKIVNNSEPVFNSKLNFPITYPILNDKITMRIWSENGGLKANTFIANIPESPCQTDYFNISKLLSSDGRMSAKWINLYGIAPNERSPRTRGKKEGSYYMGRILLAFSLIPSDVPQLGRQNGNPIKEPKQTQFKVWIDLYELTNFTFVSPDEGKELHVVVSIGNFKSQEKITMKYKKTLNCYKFKKTRIDDIDCEFPTDYNQIPDIFISFFCDEPGLDTPTNRVGYLRMKAHWLTLEQNQVPQWQKIKTIYNDTSGKDLGSILMSATFLRADSTKQRANIEKKGKQTYKFYYQIFSGYELSAGKIDENQLKSSFEIKIGSAQPIKSKKSIEGRFPQWNESESKDVTLSKDISFESDIMITIFNDKKELFGSSQDTIGSFSVDINSITERTYKPQYFNVLNEEGHFVGQILASFYLKFYKKNPKNLKETEILHNKTQNEINEILNEQNGYSNCSVHFSCLGIRDLLKKFKWPVVSIRLTNSDEKKEIEIKEENVQGDERESLNPTFAKVVKFENVSLYKEPLLWPHLEIKIKDKDQGLFDDGLLFTTVSLIAYAPDILSNKELDYALRQLQRNQDSLGFRQQQIAYIPDQEESESEQDEDSVDKKERRTRLTQAHGSINQARKTVANQGLANNFGNRRIGTKTMRKSNDANDLFHFIELDDYDDPDERMQRAAELAWNNEMFGDNGINQNFGMDQQGEQALKEDSKPGVQNDDLETGLLIPFTFKITNDHKQEIDLVPEKINVYKKDKQIEENLRESRLQSCNDQIKTYQRKLTEDTENIEKTRLINMKIMEIKEEIEEINREKMTKEKFWGLGADDDEEEFDYGRDTLKELTVEKYLYDQGLVPYEHLDLFTKPKWSFFADKQQYVIGDDNILRSGTLNQAKLKSYLKVQNDESEGDSDISQSDEEGQEGNENAKKDLNKQKSIQDQPEEQTGGGGNKAEQINRDLMKIRKDLEFDIFNEEYIKKFADDHTKDFKIRIYIISCQNLSAVDSVIDLKSQLAGMTAMCTANPFPALIIGDGEESNGKKIKKQIDRESAIEGELSPQFLKIYEFDARLPEDWKLTIQILHRSSVKGFDQMMGETKIDLETRRHSDLLFQNRVSNEIKTKENREKFTQLRKDKDKNKNNKEKLKELEEAEAQAQEEKINLVKYKKDLAKIQQVLVPIEFREIYHPQKTQAQGVIEMFTEILTAEDSRKFPTSKIKTLYKENYEIRLVIWETKDVPLMEGGTVDIFVKCTLDPTGWSEDEVTKETDTHMNSKDGWGQFNWRMKFDLSVPCEFPRLKFQIFDAGLASDEAIGETTLSLKRTLKKLRVEEQISIPKSYITIFNPTNPSEEKGILMFSMDILPKADANQDQVGEAQDEPNKDPFLKKPTAGRGLGDALAAIGIEMPDIDFNPFGKFLPVIIFFGVMGTVLTFAVLLK